MAQTCWIAAACLLLLVPMPGSASAQPWPAPIRSLEDSGITIVKQFKAPGGLTGFAARAGNRPIALYLTPDGEHVILGTLLDANGQNLTQSQLDDVMPAPDADEAWPALEQSNWVLDGRADAPRTIYVFTDPNCPYCHTFYEIARPWVEAGQVQLHHIPVGILKPSSPAKAAAILAADDPSAALQRHESNYKRGGIEPMADIPDAIRRKVAANSLLMSSLGARGTPGIVYRDREGKIALRQGVPSGAAREEILGPKP